jgi:hypothetical protein
MCLMSVSCKTYDPTIATSATSTARATIHTQDTVVLRDSIVLRDSVVFRERTVLDTVYITKEVYRDRLHSTLNSQHSTLADTIHIVEYRDRVIELPPERYVPKFYKWCTGLLWAIGLLAIGYWLLKWWLKCRV